MGTADAEVAAYIGRWEPSSVSPPAAAFARDVIGQAGPEGREQAKSLLWAAGRLISHNTSTDQHSQARDKLSRALFATPSATQFDLPRTVRWRP